jgi:histidinol-phosphate aminotransferase
MDFKGPEWFSEFTPNHMDDIPEYSPGKPVEELERETGVKDAIKMASNENPLGPSPKGVAAIQACLNRIHVYPQDAPIDLRVAIGEKFGLPPDSVILGNGSDEALSLITHLMVSPGKEVIVAERTFSLYGILARSFGGKVITVPMRNFGFDLKATIKAISEQTRIIFLTAPNNPTGAVISSDDFERFLDGLPEPSPVIVVDQAYAEFVTEDSCAMAEKYLDYGVPILALRTFSKAYGLAGLRIGYGLAQPWLIERLNRIRPPFTVNALAHCAAKAALTDDMHLIRTRENNTLGLSQITKDLEDMGLQVLPSQANFLSFSIGHNAKEVYEGLLMEGVIVRHLASFGLNDFLRVTIGLPEENERMINALKKVLGRTK